MVARERLTVEVNVPTTSRGIAAEKEGRQQWHSVEGRRPVMEIMMCDSRKT